MPGCFTTSPSRKADWKPRQPGNTASCAQPGVSLTAGSPGKTPRTRARCRADVATVAALHQSGGLFATEREKEYIRRSAVPVGLRVH